MPPPPPSSRGSRLSLSTVFRSSGLAAVWIRRGDASMVSQNYPRIYTGLARVCMALNERTFRGRQFIQLATNTWYSGTQSSGYPGDYMPQLYNWHSSRSLHATRAPSDARARPAHVSPLPGVVADRAVKWPAAPAESPAGCIPERGMRRRPPRQHRLHSLQPVSHRPARRPAPGAAFLGKRRDARRYRRSRRYRRPTAGGRWAAPVGLSRGSPHRDPREVAVCAM